MKRVHIIGRQGVGKTTLITEILTELRSREIAVGTIKHTRHDYETDLVGKDSWQHRRAGAEPAAFVAGSNMALHRSIDSDTDLYKQLEPSCRGCDLVLVEGDRQTDAPKIELIRQGQKEPPYMESEDCTVSAVISDRPCETTVPVWLRTEVRKICDHLLLLVNV